jgi:MOSC domain-containing protein YiiM
VTGRIEQVNVSPGGVPKRPVGEAFVTPLGLDGDGHAHPRIHGGPDKALLLICAEVVDDLVAQGYPLFYGALGENLTTRGLDRRLLRDGQRFRAGGAVLELVKLRAPCATLDVYGATLGAELYDKACKSGDYSSPRWAMGGYYARVVETGVVRPGDPIALIDMEA